MGKDWQRYVKCWFNQPARKLKRHNNLKPIVRCPGIRYNSKQRLGKGFSLQELKAAGIGKHYGRTIGIAVDYKRRNKSVEGLQENAQRLKNYKSKLILFPRKANKPKKGDASAEDIAKATQIPNSKVIVKRLSKDKARKVTEADQKYSCFIALRTERANERYWGTRAKKARESAEEAAVTGKK